jgi:hypothetical protein
MAHTPGPWTVADDGTIEARHAGLVGHLSNMSDNDRALVAAAPKLLDALRWALDQIEDSLDPDHQAALAHAQALVAELDGGASC